MDLTPTHNSHEWPDQAVKIKTLDSCEFAQLLSHLVQDSVGQGFNMLERLVLEYQSGVNRFDKPGEALFGVYRPKAGIVAVGGLNLNPYPDDPGAGRVRRVYVHSSFRQQGLGRAIVEAIVAEARRAHYVSLVLRAPKSAFRFYESLGFEAVSGIDTMNHRLML